MEKQQISCERAALSFSMLPSIFHSEVGKHCPDRWDYFNFFAELPPGEF